MRKLYCYVDESGQDTEGKIFVVSIVITEDQLRLADAMAGFIRDALDKNPGEETRALFETARRRGLLREV
jgi:hypothetical protein